MGAAFVLSELDLWYFRGQPTGGPRVAVLEESKIPGLL
jgi:hypothetical protein